MCYICDGIAETCGWQRAQKLGSALEAYFAKWEESVCHHCDEGLAEFVDELSKSRDQGCQTGESALTLQAPQHAEDSAPESAPVRLVVLRPGMQAPNPPSYLPRKIWKDLRLTMHRRHRARSLRR